MAGRVYKNRSTGEITTDRTEAFRWYCGFDEVDVYQNGRFIFGFRM